MNIYNQSMPLCDNGCGKNAIRFTKKGKAICSNRPAGCPAVLEKMRNTSLAKFGVPNASSAPTVKQKRKKKVLDKYGVDNVSKAEGVKEAISRQKTEYWHILTETIISESKNNQLSLTQKEYNKIVGKITNYMYSTHIATIDPTRKRGKDWQLDHKVSRFNGYYNGIPPHIIGDINNLELIPGIVNETKRHVNSITIDELYVQYNNFYENNEKPIYDSKFFTPNCNTKQSTYTKELGICNYCGSDAHYKYENGKWCCSPHRNQCPAIKEKNSTNQRNSTIKKAATAKRRLKHHLR